MTVSELIKELEKQPQGAKVYIDIVKLDSTVKAASLLNSGTIIKKTTGSGDVISIVCKEYM